MAKDQPTQHVLTGAPSFTWTRENGETITIHQGEAIDPHRDVATLAADERKLFTRTPTAATTIEPASTSA